MPPEQRLNLWKPSPFDPCTRAPAGDCPRNVSVDSGGAQHAARGGTGKIDNVLACRRAGGFPDNELGGEFDVERVEAVTVQQSHEKADGDAAHFL